MIIGLTGPIASGKNEAAKILKRRGAIIIDADKLAHTLYEPQTPVWREVVKTFGSKILLRGGKINRKKLGEMVFGDRKKLAELNKIIHPHLRAEIKRKIANDSQLVIINAAIPSLFDGLVDATWVVIAPTQKRLSRLVKAGFSKADALKRMRSQLSSGGYKKIADVVIRNDGNLKQLHAKVQAHLQF